MLVDIVCKGGNYLLNIGPSPEGEWADSAYIRFQEIGDWMKINSEAIYESRPFYPFKSGKVCFTSGHGGNIYIIYLAEPYETTMPATIEVKGFNPTGVSDIEQLGRKGAIKWKNEQDSGLLIKIPESLRDNPPCKHAWAFRVHINNRDK